MKNASITDNVIFFAIYVNCYETSENDIKMGVTEKNSAKKQYYRILPVWSFLPIFSWMKTIFALRCFTAY